MTIFVVEAVLTFLATLLLIEVASWIGLPERALTSALISLPMTLALVIPLMLVSRSAPLEAHISDWLDKCTVELDDWCAKSRPAWQFGLIAAAAGMGLFLELAIIRWEGSQFAVFALYKNFILLACFCGLGIGYATSSARQITLPLFLPLLFALIVSFTILRNWPDPNVTELLQVVPVREETSVISPITPATSGRDQLILSMLIYVLLAGSFALNVLVLAPIGQFCGRIMDRMPPRRAYGYNLLGSLAGTALMFVLSWFWTGPTIWIGFVCAGLVLFQIQAASARISAIVFAVACPMALAWPVQPLIQVIYSPYQLLETTTQPNGMLAVLASGAYFQKIYDLPTASGRWRGSRARQNSRLL